MSVSGVFSAIIVGAIIGVIGRLIVPGRQQITWWMTLLIGVVAALIGTIVARLFGVADTQGVDWIELLLQIIFAVIGVALVSGAMSRRRGTPQ